MFPCVYKTARETLKMLTDHFIWFSFIQFHFPKQKTFQLLSVLLSQRISVTNMLIYLFIFSAIKHFHICLTGAVTACGNMTIYI